MQRKPGLMMLSAALALIVLSGFALDTAIAPQPLQAQACGNLGGPKCADDCVRECANGGCCSWQVHYYPKPEGET